MTVGQATQNASLAPRSRRGSLAYFRNLIVYSANFYLLLLAIYLILRLIFKDGLWWLAFFNNFVPFYFIGVGIITLLAILLRERLLFFRTIPFLMIGLGWFGPLYLPKTIAPATGPTLKIVQFNLLGRNGYLEKVDAWLPEQNADIVTLQEGVERADYINLPDLSNDYSLYRSSQLEDQGGGSATFTQLEVIDETDPEYQVYVNGKRIVVDFEGTPIAVYNVHLRLPIGQPQLNLPFLSDRFSAFFAYNDTVRNRQIAALLEHLKTEPLPYIVAGDFNLSDWAAPYWDIAAQMTDSFREAGIGLGGSWPRVHIQGQYIPLFPAVVRIDYVWHSAHFRAVEAVQGPYLGSDHLPLVVTLELIEE